MLIAGCGSPTITNQDSQGTRIICFGDSLTAGFGADQGEDYPSVLGRLLDRPILNKGKSGDTTADGLARLDADVLEQDPKIVIITLGGNDFLRQVPKEETLRNMSKIIDRIHAKGAMVVWAAVKTGVFADAYSKDFERLAKEKHIVLISDVLKDIMFEPQYKYDNIHPNAQGYRRMAEKVYKTIKPFVER